MRQRQPAATSSPGRAPPSPPGTAEFLRWSKQTRADYHAQLRAFVTAPNPHGVGGASRRRQDDAAGGSTDAGAPTGPGTNRKYFDPEAVRRVYQAACPPVPGVATAGRRPHSAAATRGPTRRRGRPRTAPVGPSDAALTATRSGFRSALAHAASATGRDVPQAMTQLESSRRASAAALARYVARPAHTSSTRPLEVMAKSSPAGRRAAKHATTTEELEHAWLGSPARLLRRVFTEQELAVFFARQGIGADADRTQPPSNRRQQRPRSAGVAATASRRRPKTAQPSPEPASSPAPGAPPAAPATDAAGRRHSDSPGGRGSPPRRTRRSGVPSTPPPPAAKPWKQSAVSLVLSAPDGDASDDAPTVGPTLSAQALPSQPTLPAQSASDLPPAWTPHVVLQHHGPDDDAATGGDAEAPEDSDGGDPQAADALLLAATLPIGLPDGDSDSGDDGGGHRPMGEALAGMAELGQASAQHLQGILNKYAKRVQYKQDAEAGALPTAGNMAPSPGDGGGSEADTAYDPVADSPAAAQRPATSPPPTARSTRGRRQSGRRHRKPTASPPQRKRPQRGISLYDLPGASSPSTPTGRTAGSATAVPPAKRKQPALGLKQQLAVARRVAELAHAPQPMRRMLREYVLEPANRRRRVLDAEVLQRVLHGMLRQFHRDSRPREAEPGDPVRTGGGGAGAAPPVPAPTGATLSRDGVTFRMAAPHPEDKGYDDYVEGIRWVKGLYSRRRVYNPSDLQPVDAADPLHNTPPSVDSGFYEGHDVAARGVSGYDPAPAALLLSPVKQAPSVPDSASGRVGGSDDDDDGSTVGAAGSGASPGGAAVPHGPVRHVIDTVRAARAARNAGGAFNGGHWSRRHTKDPQPTGVRQEHQQAPPSTAAGATPLSPPVVISLKVDDTAWRTKDVSDDDDDDDDDDDSTVLPGLHAPGRPVATLKQPSLAVAASILDRKPAPGARRAASRQRAAAKRLSQQVKSPSRFRPEDVAAAIMSGAIGTKDALPPGVYVGSTANTVKHRAGGGKPKAATVSPSKQEEAMKMLALSHQQRAFFKP